MKGILGVGGGARCTVKIALRKVPTLAHIGTCTFSGVLYMSAPICSSLAPAPFSLKGIKWSRKKKGKSMLCI